MHQENQRGEEDDGRRENHECDGGAKEGEELQQGG